MIGHVVVIILIIFLVHLLPIATSLFLESQPVHYLNCADSQKRGSVFFSKFHFRLGMQDRFPRIVS